MPLSSREVAELFEEAERYFLGKGLSREEAATKAQRWVEAQRAGVEEAGEAAFKAGETAAAARAAEVIGHDARAAELYTAATDALKAATERLRVNQAAAAAQVGATAPAAASITGETLADATFEAMKRAQLAAMAPAPRGFWGRLIDFITRRGQTPAGGTWSTTVSQTKAIEGAGGAQVQTFTETIPNPLLLSREEYLEFLKGAAGRLSGRWDAMTAAEAGVRRAEAAAAAGLPPPEIPPMYAPAAAAPSRFIRPRAPSYVAPSGAVLPGQPPAVSLIGPARVLSLPVVLGGVSKVAGAVMVIGGGYMFLSWGFQERGSSASMGSFTAQKADKPELMVAAAGQTRAAAEDMAAAIEGVRTGQVDQRTIGQALYGTVDLWAGYPDVMYLSAQVSDAMALKLAADQQAATKRSDKAAGVQAASPTTQAAPRLTDEEYKRLSHEEKTAWGAMSTAARRAYIAKLHAGAPTPSAPPRK